ncbi:MAG: hypothetical protein KJS83_12240, partial [Xanthomonadaceae bacterium]|nr:hypothetical protein [Xanthomonadaceae bacterium]
MMDKPAHENFSARRAISRGNHRITTLHAHRTTPRTLPDEPLKNRRERRQIAYCVTPERSRLFRGS